MHADRHTSRGVYTMFWTLTIYVLFDCFNIYSYLYIVNQAV